MTVKDAKRLAYDAVKKALACGVLIRPDECEHCGEAPRGQRPLHGHHANGYDEAHRLDVQWLCGKCHSATHCNEASMNATTPEQRQARGRRGGEAVKAKRTRDDWSAMGRKGGVRGGQVVWERLTSEEREIAITRVTGQLADWQANSTHEERSDATRKGWAKISSEERRARALKAWATRRQRSTEESNRDKA